MSAPALHPPSLLPYSAIKDGSLPKLRNSVMEGLHPEAAYFYPEGGKRTALMVFDMKDPSQIPSVVKKDSGHANEARPRLFEPREC